MSPLRLAFGLALGLARFAYALVLPTMREDLGWSYAQAGGMNAANALGYLLAAPMMARLGARHSFLSGLGLTTIALLLSGSSPLYGVLVALRLLAGVSGALVFIAGGALAARDPTRSALGLGLYFGGVGLGILASGVLLPGLLEAHPERWRGAWVVLGGLALLGSSGAALAARQVVQLMDPGSKDKPEFMPVKKFLSIYNRVAASVAVQGEAEVRFEYGNLARPAIHYHVEQIEVEGDKLVVRLTPPGVTCKAADRAKAAGCCGAAAEAGAGELPVARGCC